VRKDRQLRESLQRLSGGPEFELSQQWRFDPLPLGGEIRVESRIDSELVASEHRRREKLGIGTDDEDIGHETEETGVVDLSVWKPRGV